MTDNRQGNGRFGPGNTANPNGRPKKSRSINATILRELNASVMITENQKRRRVTKAAASAKQIANMGASGELRAAKLALEMGQKAEDRAQTSAVLAPAMTESDHEIAARVIARLRLIIAEGGNDENADA